MREVKPTQKPVPSSDIKDLFFNSGLLDIWATSLEPKYIDRFGNCHLTAAGMEWLFKELVEKFKIDMNTAIVAAGYITIDSFQQGADLPNNELTQRNHILRDETTGEYYRWDGDLPKQVPAGSTPQSTGGIGKGAWVSVGDASVRSELKFKQTILNGSEIADSKGYEFSSFENVIADNQFIGVIGSTYRSVGSISKTGNEKIRLFNSDPNATEIEVDTIAYMNPSWVSGQYPQQLKIDSVSLEGDSIQKNEAGLTILQAGKVTISNVTAVNCDVGLLLKDVWISSVNKFVTLGSIRQDNGTSMNYLNCWAMGTEKHKGAYHFHGLKYSNISACATDSSVNGGYYFDYCQGVVLNGCGVEGPNVMMADTGAAITLHSNNNIIFNGFTYVPKRNSQFAAIVVSGNSNIVDINSFDANFSVPFSTDIYVSGNSSIITLRNFKSYNGRSPVVQFKAGSTSRVVLHSGHRTYIYADNGTGAVAVREVDMSYGDAELTPPSSVASGISSTCKYVKNNSTVKVDIQLSMNSSISSASEVNIFLGGLPFISEFGATSLAFIASGLDTNDVKAVINTASNTIGFYKKNQNGYRLITNKDITSNVEISVSISYEIKDSLFK